MQISTNVRLLGLIRFLKPPTKEKPIAEPSASTSFEKHTKKTKIVAKNSVEYFVAKLVKPFQNTNRLITCDNWFSSVPLFEKMLNESI